LFVADWKVEKLCAPSEMKLLARHPIRLGAHQRAPSRSRVPVVVDHRRADDRVRAGSPASEVSQV
jgi:hypothetical protein